jgi:type II secretory pathway component PulK
MKPEMPRPRPSREASSEKGVVLVLVLLITALLYMIVSELAVRSEFDAMTSGNYGVEARIREGMKLALRDVLQDLADDADESAGEGEGLEGAGALGAALGGATGGGDAGAAGAEGMAEEAAGSPGDSSRDAWFQPQSYFDDNEVTVYAFVEDENRKFNLLCLLSEDEEFREQSRNRAIRILDVLWEDTAEDITRAEAESWILAIEDWMNNRNRNDDRPRMPLATNELRNEVTIPVDLDELRMLPQIPEEVWDDRIVGREVRMGLSGVFTVHTSLKGPSSAEGAAEGSGADPAAAGEAGAESLDPEAETALGAGVRVNVNTAPPAVLRGLEDEYEIPRRVVDELLRHRNEIDEDAQAQANEQAENDEQYGLVQEGEEEQKKIFDSVDALDDVEAWMNLPQSASKERFQAMLTTSSHVFTVHLAAVYRMDSGGKSFLVSRSRGVFVRVQDGEKTVLQPLVPMRRTESLRLVVPDFPEDAAYEQESLDSYSEFGAEEQLWNPFFLDFYDPEKRNQRR